MPETTERRANRAPWLAFLFTLVAIGLNFATFITARGTWVLLWSGLLAGLVALVYGVIGIKQAFGRTQAGGKISSSIFGVLALLICGLTIFGWFSSRALPASTGAPKVGQKAPDFMLADTQGNKVSLGQLLSGNGSGGSGSTSGSGPAPKAVLLIFYRGYW